MDVRFWCQAHHPPQPRPAGACATHISLRITGQLDSAEGTVSAAALEGTYSNMDELRLEGDGVTLDLYGRDGSFAGTLTRPEGSPIQVSIIRVTAN